jgi:hypothetical protein
VADRTSIRNTLESSVIVSQDVNGDCDVTDVDYALLIEGRLTQLTGRILKSATSTAMAA